MPTRRLLYLTAHQLAAYRWQAGRISEETSFDEGDAGGGFLAYLRQHPESLFALVVNVGEEGFQLDAVPYLHARDRRTVVERRLGQLFPGAALTVAISLGYEKTRRKDEKILFAALNNSALLGPWLTALKQAEARLSGIYSLPLLAESQLPALAPANARGLLVTVQDTTLRQTFFDRGHLHFSRLSPLGDSSISGIAQAVASDVVKTQQYLLGQRLVARHETLPVHVVAHAQAAPAIAAACAGIDSLSFALHDLHALARKLGLRTLPDDSRAELLHLHTAATRPPRQQFAPAPLRQQFRLWQIASGLRAFGAAVFVGCVAVAAAAFVDLVELRDAAVSAQLNAAQAEARYRAITAGFPPLPVEHDALRALTIRYAELERRGVGPAGLYAKLSLALDDASQIELESIEWQIGELGAKPPAGGESMSLRGIVRIDGGATARELLRVFDAFVARLRATPGLTVAIDQQPFDVGSGKALKRRDEIGDGDPARPFHLTISRVAGT